MDAYQKVQSNGGSAGVDAISLEEFAKDERSCCINYGTK